ncbi:MAG TPA: hypothetical protein VFE11_00635 [Dongiaceae bacterium]|nr:hypothetical protein [Dongiaceae bacterium]
MDRQQLEAALSLFMEEIEEKSDDSHEIFMRLVALLNQMRALGMAIPADLAEMEANLAQEFTADAAEAEDAPATDKGKK